MTPAILALNAGSSSLKFSLTALAPTGLATQARGEIESTDTTPHLVVRDPAGTTIAERRWPGSATATQEDLLNVILAWVQDRLGGGALAAVGHRVVHGGLAHDRPIRLDDALLSELEALTPLAPLHQPHSLAPIRVLRRRHPDLPQVACFDTAFHATMPDVAKRFALPRRFAADGVRRYGFHGLSYEFIARRLAEIAPALHSGRVIVAHLGHGASLCAMRAGRSIDTTMGFTALDGLMMGTRCGNIDPGVILYLQRTYHMTAADVEDLLYRHSGLLAVSEMSADIRQLLASDDSRARDAVELFVFRVAREVAALCGSLGGLDGLVFTAGIGEHAAPIRRMVCDRIGWLGARLDDEANCRNAPLVSTAESSVRLMVVPTDEEAMLARHTADLLGLSRADANHPPVKRVSFPQ